MLQESIPQELILWEIILWEVTLYTGKEEVISTKISQTNLSHSSLSRCRRTVEKHSLSVPRVMESVWPLSYLFLARDVILYSIFVRLSCFLCQAKFL